MTKFKLTLLCLSFCFFSYGQITFDGNEGCSEYSEAFVPNQQPSGGSSTCEVSGVYGVVYELGGKDYVQIGIEHGNGGQSNFRIYLNTDCDSTTGQLLASERDGDPATINVGGADYMINFTTGNNNTSTIYEWNGTSMSIYTGTDVQRLLGLNCEGSSSFAEIRFPIENSGLFDPCDPNPNPCGSIELTSILSNAGNVLDSRFCEEVSLKIEVDVNTPPDASFTSERSCFNNDTEVGYLLSPATLVDPNFGAFPGSNDVVTYTWSASPECIGCFNNESGQALTAIDIETNFIPNQATDYTISLVLSDLYGCTVDISSYSTFISVTEEEVDPDLSLCEEAIVAPVTLVSSELLIHNQNIEFVWSTISEINNRGFYVERGIDGVNFETLGWVDGSGTSSTRKNYSFIDYAPLIGTSYYRLLQVDYDGLSSIEGLSSVNYMDNHLHSVYPSFVQSSLTIKGTGDFTVYSSMGAVIDKINNDNAVYYLDVLDYIPGVYIVRFENGETFQFVKS